MVPYFPIFLLCICFLFHFVIRLYRFSLYLTLSFAFSINITLYAYFTGIYTTCLSLLSSLQIIIIIIFNKHIRMYLFCLVAKHLHNCVSTTQLTFIHVIFVLQIIVMLSKYKIYIMHKSYKHILTLNSHCKPMQLHIDTRSVLF